MRFYLILIFLTTTFFLQAEKPKVVSSFSVINDIVEVLGGEFVDAKMVVPIGSDPHLYEPLPSDAKMVNAADLILVNGLSFEGWLNELIENSGTEASVVTVTQGLNPLSSAEYKNSFDPHAWMRADYGIIYARNIKDALAELIPDQKEVFEFNFNVYKNQLEDLDNYIIEQINSISEEKRVLITSHDAFSYYGQHYGIQLEALQGISTEADIQTSDISHIVRLISERNIPAIFTESTINPKILETIAGDSDIEIGGTLFADSLGEEDSPTGTYIKMLRNNTNTIVEALRKKSIKKDESRRKTLSPVLFMALLLPIVITLLVIIFRKK